MEQKDSALARRIHGILIEDERAKDYSIDVLDNNGVVTLSGTVPDEKARQRAEQVVEEQEGVVEVINELELERDEGEGYRLPPDNPPQNITGV